LPGQRSPPLPMKLCDGEYKHIKLTWLHRFEKKKLSSCQTPTPLCRTGLLFCFSLNIRLQPAPEEPNASVAGVISPVRPRKSWMLLLEGQPSAPCPLPFPRAFPFLLVLSTARFPKAPGGSDAAAAGELGRGEGRSPPCPLSWGARRKRKPKGKGSPFLAELRN